MSLTRPNNVTTNYAYDNLSRLQSVLHQLAGSTIDGAAYTVDNAGNRTAKTDQGTGVTTNYGYDQIYQLLSATGGSNTQSYNYEPGGHPPPQHARAGEKKTPHKLTPHPNPRYGVHKHRHT